MYSGRQALSDIDRSLQSIRSSLTQSDYDLNQSSNRLLDVRQQESETYRHLAILRLDQIQAQQLTGQLDYAEKQALQLVFQRKQAIKDISQDIEQSLHVQQQYDVKRIKQANKLDDAIEHLEGLLNNTHKLLADDKSYQQQQLRAQDSIDMAGNAADKTKQAEAEREMKSAPYKEDKIFSYLWDRNYGTSDYNAGFISRYFDKKLADHIHYDQARINFFSLNNIPKRLAEHTENLQEQAEQQMNQLTLLERNAELAAGAETLEEQVESERNQLAEIDKAITADEQKYNELIKKRDSFNLGSDNYTRGAIEVLVDSFKADPIPVLQDQVRQTSTPVDDELVNLLSTLAASKERLDSEIASLQRLRHTTDRKHQELTEIRRKFKRSDFDANNSNFNGGELISGLLLKFTNNQVSSKEMWREFKSMQRFIRQRHTRRHGGLGLPGGLGDIINSIPSSRPPRGVRFPSNWGGSGRSSGGGSSGGFRTGGGF